jgi:hypothetical protein
MSALITTTWEVEIEYAHEVYRRDRNEHRLRRTLERLGLADHEIDGHLKAERNQRPADGLLHSNFDRQQGVM